MVNLIGCLILSQAIKIIVQPKCVERLHRYTETVSLKGEYFKAVTSSGERLLVNEEVV